MERIEKVLVNEADAAPLSRFDSALGDWRFSINLKSGKIEICRANRPELAHLTIAWRTQSRTLDIHLTFAHEQARGEKSGKRWEPIATIPLDELNALGEQGGRAIEAMSRSFIRAHARRFRPGWLARNGYAVCVFDRETLTELFKAAAPKERGKYRLQPNALLEPARLSATVGDFLFDPAVLHVVDVSRLAGPVNAVRLGHHGGVDRHGILLNHGLGPNGKRGWWGMKNRELNSWQAKMVLPFFDWLVPRIRPEHAEKFEQIARGLGLDEDEHACDVADGVRLFLSQPRNPVRQPYPRPRRSA